MRIALILLATLLIFGCGSRNFTNENDRLRAENLQLKQQIKESESKLNLRIGEIKSLRQRIDRSDAAIQGANLPILTKLKFDRYTSALDRDGDGVDDVIRIYLRTLDQHGRFMPVAALVVVQSVVIQQYEPPFLLAERTLQPEQFDTCYRTSWTGTHYTLELELPNPLPAGIQNATTKISLTEAISGIQLTAQQPIKIATGND